MNLQSILPGGFDSSAVAPQESRDYSPLPAGVYTAEITGSEVIALKSGKGTGLKIEFTVIDPEQYARRKVWQNLNIVHENEEAQQIAQSQLSALCRAVGIGVLKDSDDLFQRIVHIRLRVRPAKDNYAASNDVTGYEMAGAGSAPAAAAARPAPARGAPAAAAKAAPWAKKAAA